ncbi:DUF1707 domain-containing protein [Nocardioides sp. InS609-2]|uniref:DUF1707 SHOCT-like domain-containing protein n=1 Tax=Nocardioides sp. InS609-2 TaxID=2760705 RepID=UPI0020BEC195|nr:DUF1707 domain-containing protein [Nocardioides sp. InS609-2]
MGETPEPHQMRISDADRQRVAEVLRDAAGDGRIDFHELDERLDATWSAKTYGDLVPLTLDLPAHPQHPVPRPASAPVHPVAGDLGMPTYNTSIAIMSGIDRRGAWTVGASHSAFAMMGGIGIDLREALFTNRETVITASAFWGGIDITVNAHTQVIVEGVGIMGAFDQGRDKVPAEITADSPIVRVRGFALMGAVTVQRKGPPGPPRKSLHGGHR